MTNDALLALLGEAADAIAAALAATPSWGLRDGSGHQHHSDVATDRAAHQVLDGAGVGVLSEESGLTGADRPIVVVVDPLDGSTNAAQGLPWYATSLCAVDEAGPVVALVRNLATGVEFGAVRGKGAWRDSAPLRASGGHGAPPSGDEPGAPPSGNRSRPRYDRSRLDGDRSRPGEAGDPQGPARGERAKDLADAIVGISGLPRGHLGWRQFRALGALALDLCAVAEGSLDAFVDCSVDAHGVWDYLGGLLVCAEAGLDVVDACGRDLVVVDPSARRTPIAGTPGVVAELVARWPAAVGRA